jgi:hypothetical protein
VPPDDLEAAIAALREELEAERAERARHVEELRGSRRIARGYDPDTDKTRRRRRGKLTDKERRADAKRKRDE